MTTTRSLIERTGASAFELRARIGLGELHRIEGEILVEQLSWVEPCVINAAASTVEDPALRLRLRAAFVVWLRADPALLATRVANGPPRPTVTDRPVSSAHDIEVLARRRHDDFAAVADLVVDTTSEPPESCVNRIIDALGPEADGRRHR